jgi:hypothetical protein
MDLDAEYRALVSVGQISARFLCTPKEPVASLRVLDATLVWRRRKMGRGILLWLLGVPIPIIILLWLFFGR